MNKISFTEALPIVLAITIASGSLGCAHRPRVTSAYITGQSSAVLPRLTDAYDSGTFRVLTIAASYSSDHRHDADAQKQILADKLNSIGGFDPNIVVGLGATAYLATAAFLWNEKELVNEIISEYQLQPNTQSCCRSTVLSPTRGSAQLYSRVAVALAHEAGIGRVLLINLVDSSTGVVYLVDLSHLCTAGDVGWQSECLKEAMRRSLAVCSKRHHYGGDTLVSGAISIDSFHDAITLIAAEEEAKTQAHAFMVGFHLIDITATHSNSKKSIRNTDSLNIAMESLMQESKDEVVSSMTRLVSSEQAMEASRANERPR